MVETEVKEEFVKHVASTLDWNALCKAASEVSNDADAAGPYHAVKNSIEPFHDIPYTDDSRTLHPICGEGR